MLAGVRVLTEIDLFEVSIVPAPANADARILALKAADVPDQSPSDADQRRRLALLTNPALIRIHDQERDRVVALDEPDDTKAIAESLQQVRIATFEVS